MKRMLSIVLMSLMVLIGCEKERETIIPPGSIGIPRATVFSTKKVDGVWKLYKGESEFYINGAATNNFYAEVCLLFQNFRIIP